MPNLVNLITTTAEARVRGYEKFSAAVAWAYLDGSAEMSPTPTAELSTENFVPLEVPFLGSWGLKVNHLYTMSHNYGNPWFLLYNF